MKKHFTVCASRFDMNICEITLNRTFFNIPFLIVSIEGYINANELNAEYSDINDTIIEYAYRKARLLNIIANRKLPRRNKHTK